MGNNQELSIPSSENTADSQKGEVIARAGFQEFELDQILYCSLSRTAMDKQSLERLAQDISVLNRMDHITGLLMHSDGVFVQLIEGPHGALAQLWERLIRDPRHFGVVKLYHHRELEERSCEGWDMKLVDFDTLRDIIHEAREELQRGRRTRWSRAIERMDFLLSSGQWRDFVQKLRQQANPT